MHRLSFAQQSSRYQVPWPPVQQRTAIAGNYKPRLYGKLGFVWKQVSVAVFGNLGSSTSDNLFFPWIIPSSIFDHVFVYWRVSRKLQSCKIFTHQIFKHKFYQRKHFQIQHINLKINSTVDGSESQGQPPWDGAKTLVNHGRFQLPFPQRVTFFAGFLVAINRYHCIFPPMIQWVDENSSPPSCWINVEV